jgi:hypothetical protein
MPSPTLTEVLNQPNEIGVPRDALAKFHLGSLGAITKHTDYGPPMKPFFIEIPNFWAWEDKSGR